MKFFLSVLALTLFSFSVKAQEFTNGVLKIGDHEFKEGTEFKLGTSSSNMFQYVVQGTVRMMTTKAPTGAWANAPVKVVDISKKKDKYELKLKVTNFEGVNKILLINSIWVTDIEEAIKAKEIILN
jgi:hypothetical protein